MLDIKCVIFDTLFEKRHAFFDCVYDVIYINNIMKFKNNKQQKTNEKLYIGVWIEKIYTEN